MSAESEVDLPDMTDDDYTYADDEVGPVMHKVCVKARPLVMVGR